ncbi:Basic fibroblast growth factor receptor 1 [Oopsacas minuta]|uniref:Basic fibroblast growth factor receptor 1 n=1 Tax=Oopsacas minuta TaxID=111878 RepID=A0AAV7JN48_9METZ|nr:Basic fibroblast growth factor receptor 1 [Oopsacas minuta]
MHCILLLLISLYTYRANVIISPDPVGLDSYIFYENITEHIYCQSSVPIPGLIIQRPEGPLITTGMVEILEPEIRVVIKFDPIISSDAGIYICKGDEGTLANSIDIELAQLEVLEEDPYNQATQIMQQFLSNDSIYPVETSYVLTEGRVHTFHCPSQAEFIGIPGFTVITHWFRNELAVTNDSYHNSFFDGRLLLQINPIEAQYICKGYLPLPGYPVVTLMIANLTVIPPPTMETTVPTVLPVYAIVVIPIGVILFISIFAVCIALSGLAVFCLLRRRPHISSISHSSPILRSGPLFRRSLEINYKRLNFGAKIAEGSYGRFYQAKLDEDNVVVKRFEGEWGDKRADVERDVMLRIENRKQITSMLSKNNNFVQVLGFISKRVPYCIVYEDMNAGNLTNFLSQLRKGPVPHWYLSLLTNLWADKYAPRVSDDLVTICCHVSQGMKYLEQKRILHRSLSTSKVLFQEQRKAFVVKISGFSPEGEQAGSNQEKLYYGAPEVLNGSPHSNKSDVYSLSLLLLSIATVGGTGVEYVARLSQVKKLKVTQPPNVAEKLFAVITDGLNQTPSERPTLQHISEDLDKLTADTPASTLIRLRLSEEIVPGKKTWHQWDEAILLAKPPLLRSTDASKEGYLIDTAEIEKRVSKEVLLRAKKDPTLTRSISVGPLQPDVAGVDSNVSLRMLRKDKKNIAGLV